MKQAFWRGGFTLIELLVVITIIGILSAILYASFGDSRELARNNAMQTELKEVQLALELYKSQNGDYPSTPGGACSGSGGGVDTANSGGGCAGGVYIANLTTDFIADLPSHTDSLNSNCDIVYSVDATNHSWYKLTAENCAAGVDGTTGVQAGDLLARCPSSCALAANGNKCGSINPYDATDPDFYESYAVYSAGGECI